jgi:hypothetical protein
MLGILYHNGYLRDNLFFSTADYKEYPAIMLKHYRFTADQLYPRAIITIDKFIKIHKKL